MTKSKLLYLLAAMLLVTAYTACTKTETGRNPCLEPKTYYLKLKTYRSADTGTVAVDSVLPSPVLGFVDTNIWFTDGRTRNNDFNGPLSGIADSVRWFIQPDTLRPSQRDTITFHYERKPVFLSSACGYAFVYSLQRLQTTNNLIDSAKIERTEVNGATDAIHVKVFF